MAYRKKRSQFGGIFKTSRKRPEKQLPFTSSTTGGFHFWWRLKPRPRRRRSRRRSRRAAAASKASKAARLTFIWPSSSSYSCRVDSRWLHRSSKRLHLFPFVGLKMLGIPDIFPPPQLYLVRGGPFRASPSCTGSLFEAWWTWWLFALEFSHLLLLSRIPLSWEMHSISM